MAYLFVHGLGQTADSWAQTLSHMELRERLLCPELFSLLEGKAAGYDNLYRAFSDYCDGQPDNLHLCGLSLGAVLALHYAAEHPGKVASLVLIAPQYRGPKLLLQVQDMIFRFMPQEVFVEMGISKENFRRLNLSMGELDLSDKLGSVACPVLLLCGERDKANRKAARELKEKISGARLYFVEDAEHEINVQSPEKLAKLLMEFYR